MSKMMTVSELISVLIFLITPIFYENSSTFRYYFKFFVYYGVVMITSVLVIPVMMFKPKNVDNLILASYLCRNISDLLGLKWELRGGQFLREDQAFVIVANHQSSIDILGMFELWPVMKKCTVVAKKELMYAGPFGLAAWLCGLIFIDRLNAEASRQAINDSVKQLKRDKTCLFRDVGRMIYRSSLFFFHFFVFPPSYPFSLRLWQPMSRALLIKMWVYPEGTRKNTGEIHSFKKGAFHAAITAQIPILPVVFSRFYFLQSDQCLLERGRIIVTVLPPIETDGLSLESMGDLMERTRSAMKTVFDVTSEEILTEIKTDRNIFS